MATGVRPSSKDSPACPNSRCVARPFALAGQVTFNRGIWPFRSPWQNPYVERVIGSIRRECLDHVIILNEQHLRRVLRRYLRYYHGSRTHLALGKDAPEPRTIELPDMGRVVAFPEVGGLHHRYTRRAA